MNFISETDVEAAKKKRAEEWEEARAAGRKLPEEEPEEFRDNRPLYEKLKEQKDRKQEDFEEQFKFKNMIYKGLDDEDASFLRDVAKKQSEMDGKRFEYESEEYAAAEKLQAEKIDEENAKKDVPKTKIAPDFSVKPKSQKSLLASSIVRKRKSTSNVNAGEEKQSKMSDENSSESKEKVKPSASISSESSTNSKTPSSESSTNSKTPSSESSTNSKTPSSESSTNSKTPSSESGPTSKTPSLALVANYSSDDEESD